jgi:pyrroline-5-carboxylate reductase
MKIGIIGIGNMGKALIGGLIGKYGRDVSVVAWDVIETARTGLAKDVKILPPNEWFGKGETPDAVIVAVKPADVAATMSLLDEQAAASPKTVWISIAAGISIAALEKAIGVSAKVCRVMPNTPALVGEGVSCYALNRHCAPVDGETVKKILSACGKTIEVPEKLMNAVTGLSGSGPAYVYQFIEARIEGGVAAGLPYPIARESAVQTVIGAAKMVEQSGETPSTLKSRVMSPGGTTARGLLALEENNFKYAVMKAVIDATKRAEELGA